jgi:hypothetical protein
MDISRKISLPLLLMSFEIAILLTSSCYYYPNQVFALQQNPLLQKNDNINDNNITKKFTLIADENIVRISPNNNFFYPSGILYKVQQWFFQRIRNRRRYLLD